LSAEPVAGETVLLLGDPALREVSRPVNDFEDESFLRNGRRLIAALEQFRREHGFGRAMAAPQIGIHQRMIAMNLGQGPFLLVNPEIHPDGNETFSLWDDCMSFPWLMVRLQRHASVDLTFRDEKGEPRQWPGLDRAVSELVQHEIDHLDGILALDRALPGESIIARSLYLERKEFFDLQVDYSIQSTIAPV